MEAAIASDPVKSRIFDSEDALAMLSLTFDFDQVRQRAAVAFYTESVDQRQYYCRTTVRDLEEVADKIRKLAYKLREAGRE